MIFSDYNFVKKKIVLSRLSDTMRLTPYGEMIMGIFQFHVPELLQPTVFIFLFVIQFTLISTVIRIVVSFIWRRMSQEKQVAFFAVALAMFPITFWVMAFSMIPYCIGEMIKERRARRITTEVAQILLPDLLNIVELYQIR